MSGGSTKVVEALLNYGGGVPGDVAVGEVCLLQQVGKEMREVVERHTEGGGARKQLHFSGLIGEETTLETELRCLLMEYGEIESIRIWPGPPDPKTGEDTTLDALVEFCAEKGAMRAITRRGTFEIGSASSARGVVVTLFPPREGESLPEEDLDEDLEEEEKASLLEGEVVTRGLRAMSVNMRAAGEGIAKATLNPNPYPVLTQS